MKNLKPAIWIASAVFILANAAIAAWIYSSATAPRQPAGPPEPLTIAVTSTYIGSALVMIPAANG